MNVTVTVPFPITHATHLWEWINFSREMMMDDFGPKTPDDFTAELCKRIEDEITAGIYLGPDLVGYVGAVQLSPITCQLRGLVIDPFYRCQGIGTEALGKFCKILRSGVTEKIIGSCFSYNCYIQRVFYKLGAEEEGRISNATRVKGMKVDIRMYDL